MMDIRFNQGTLCLDTPIMGEIGRVTNLHIYYAANNEPLKSEYDK